MDKEAIVKKFLAKAGNDPLNAEKFAELMGEFMSDVDAQIKNLQLNVNVADSEKSDVEKSLEGKKASAKFFQSLALGKYDEAQDIARKSWGESYEKVDKALNEGTGSAGGFLVPVEFDKTVRMYMDSYSELRSRSTVLKMNTSTLKLNALTATVTVTKPGEANAGTHSQPTFAEPVLTAVKRIGFTIWSNELYEDAEADLVDILARKFAEALAKDEQNDAINSTMPGSEGLLKVPGVTAVTLAPSTTFSSLSWDDISNALSQLESISVNDARGASIIMHPTVYHVLRTKKADNGTYGSLEYYLPMAPTDQDTPKAWGHDIVLCNQMPAITDSAASTKFVVVTNLKNHLFFGDRSGIKVKIMEEGTFNSVNLGETDQQAIRVTKRSGHVTALQNGIVTIATGA